jgi:hypothetical protein
MLGVGKYVCTTERLHLQLVTVADYLQTESLSGRLTGVFLHERDCFMSLKIICNEQGFSVGSTACCKCGRATCQPNV